MSTELLRNAQQLLQTLSEAFQRYFRQTLETESKSGGFWT